jgi:hypothetical protein
MAAPKLVSVLVTFLRTLDEARSISNDALKWSVPKRGATKAQITVRRRDTFTEVAFLRAFTGWEIFLEQTFLLYLIGHKAPKAAQPARYGFPPSLVHASEWCADGKDYGKWNVGDVRKRAERWFHGGVPYTPVFQGQQSSLDRLITIRNAIAHESSTARGKFENLVRTELGTLPPNTTVGGFLLLTVPTVTPPTSFMESYLDKLEFVAKSIVPR